MCVCANMIKYWKVCSGLKVLEPIGRILLRLETTTLFWSTLLHGSNAWRSAVLRFHHTIGSDNLNNLI